MGERGLECGLLGILAGTSKGMANRGTYLDFDQHNARRFRVWTASTGGGMQEMIDEGRMRCWHTISATPARDSNIIVTRDKPVELPARRALPIYWRPVISTLH